LTERQTKLAIRENIELAPLTTLKVGGPARFFLAAQSIDEVRSAVLWTRENKLPLFILGGGSNVLISDDGFDGLVLQIALKGISVEGSLITSAAGEDWDGFVRFCVEKDLQGIECLSGIPGLVGGTPVQNVGAYGQEVSETIETVRVVDREQNDIRELSNSDCGFSYRTSIFNSSHRNRFIVLSVSFRLNPHGPPKIVYKDLREQFGERVPTLGETREAVCRIRAEKAMLVRQGGLDAQSAGSFFKNPIVAREKFTELSKRYGISIPVFPVDASSVKIPAAWLIEKSGFAKGYRKGNAGLSTKHTLALTNRGNASAADILRLKDEIQVKVREQFGIDLWPEPVFVGSENDPYINSR
jgi:UDP-N-acetylmuramate dehydrogenase